MTEQQPFQVVRSYPGFDLRRYPAHVVAQMTVTSSFDRAGTAAFRTLFGYITGQNRSQASIAMTAPVVQREQGDGSYVIAFVLPAAMTADTAPQPTNPDVEICSIPASLTAAQEFSGRWSESSYERHRVELQGAVGAAGLRTVGSPRFARYDPPFKPWFLRRNEVLVDVEEGSTPTA